MRNGFLAQNDKRQVKPDSNGAEGRLGGMSEGGKEGSKAAR